MAKMKVKSFKSETVTCPYCWYRYDDPPIIDEGNIVCPTCKIEFKYKSKSVIYYTASKIGENE